MGYDIVIGERGDESSPEPEERWVPTIAVPHAPCFPFDQTGRTNHRQPAYMVWIMFLNESRLDAWWHARCPEYPCRVALQPGDADEIRRVRRAWEAQHPGAVPGWDYGASGLPSPDDVDDGVRGRDTILARLLWLEWWIVWAVRSCMHPTMEVR